MPNNPRRSIIPILLIAAGILLLIASYAFIYLQGNPENIADNPPADDPYSEIPRVTLSQAKNAYDEGSAVFVDVREPEYFESNHIPGAISIPLDKVASRMDELDPSDWIILYCT